MIESSVLNLVNIIASEERTYEQFSIIASHKFSIHEG